MNSRSWLCDNLKHSDLYGRRQLVQNMGTVGDIMRHIVGLRTKNRATHFHGRKQSCESATLHGLEVIIGQWEHWISEPMCFPRHDVSSCLHTGLKTRQVVGSKPSATKWIFAAIEKLWNPFGLPTLPGNDGVSKGVSGILQRRSLNGQVYRDATANRAARFYNGVTSQSLDVTN